MKLAKILPLGVIPSSVILIILNTLLYDTKTVLSKYYVILSTVTSSLETLSRRSEFVEGRNRISFSTTAFWMRDAGRA